MVRYRCSRCGGLCEAEASSQGKIQHCQHCKAVMHVPFSKPGKPKTGALTALSVIGGLVSVACVAGVATHDMGVVSKGQAVAANPAPVPAPEPTAAPAPAVVSRVETPAPVRAITPANKPAPAPAAPTPAPVAVTPSPSANSPLPAVPGNLLVAAQFEGSGKANGVAPQKGPPGRLWLLRSIDTPIVKQNSFLTCAAGKSGGLMISIKGDGGFSRASKMRVRVVLRSGSGSSQTEEFRGAGAGFWNTDPQAGSAPRVGFFGVILNPNGSVSLWQGQRTASASKTVSFPGSWNAAAWHTLEYEVDTATRQINHIKVDSITVPLTTSTDFSESNTPYAGVYLSNGEGTTESAAVKEFSLSGL